MPTDVARARDEVVLVELGQEADGPSTSNRCTSSAARAVTSA
jgi:hypothetical protein